MDREKIKIIISDCHLSAGRFFEGQLNPHEDFHFDEDLVDLFEYFSTGRYGVDSNGPVDVELILNGDFFDFLNVPYQGEFGDLITEEIALHKTEAIIAGHPKVMAALRRFASLANKKITYLIGNHDADLFFQTVRERITREWDPEGEYPSPRVSILADRDRITLEEGVEIRHGNQFEAGSALNFDQPLINSYMDKPVLNIPWGSFYVLKIVTRLKWEREHIDKVRPVKAFILFGLVMDTWFTLRFCFLSAYYFLKTQLAWSPVRSRNTKATMDILKRETRLFMDLEKDARKILNEHPETKTIIFGHSHRPMMKIYPDGKQYINTGTWTRMIHLDWQGIGQQFRRTFALVRISTPANTPPGEYKIQCELRQWIGDHAPHRMFEG